MTLDDDPIWLPADCRSCGACCSSLEVPAHHVEVGRADLARMTAGAKSLVVLSGRQHTMRFSGHCCAALVTDRVESRHDCSIYEQRPEVCRDFERGSEACRWSILEKSALPMLAR